MDTISVKLKRELKDFIRKKLEEEKQVAYVITPYKLDEEEIKTLKAKFPILKNRKIVNQVDSKVIAGFIIKIGTKVYDFSLRSKLQSLKSYLYEND